jgi:formiminoglutamase
MLKDFFSPIPARLHLDKLPKSFSAHFDKFPALQENSVALIGLDENANTFREHFYNLEWKLGNQKLVDLGNLKSDGSFSNVSAGITEVMVELFNNGVFPVIIGNSDDHSAGMYKAYEDFNKEVEYCRIAAGLELSEGNSLREIIDIQPNYLFNFTLLAQQGYYVSEDVENKLNSLLFDTFRLGNIRRSIFDAEPVMRNAHFLDFDLAAIKYRDHPASTITTPNGLYAEEACQLMRFAGLSCTLDSLYLHGYNDIGDHPLSAELLAQLVWFFLNGRKDRVIDIPDADNQNYTIYRNTISNGAHEIVFCKSNMSERWWMEIPNPKTDKAFYVACTYNDYLKVCNDEMPDRWWKFYQKVM